MGDVRVVLGRVGDLVVVLNGTDDVDETLLGKAVSVVDRLLEDSCFSSSDGKNAPSEAALMAGEAFGKFSVAIEEMMGGGIIESLDVDVILRMAKMKNL